MPVYEYACRTCDHHFEELVFGDEAIACPRCSSEALTKRPSTFGVGGDGGMADARSLEGSPPGACGTCGDPRGPGACSLD